MIDDLTFVVFTYNEAVRIKNVIRNFRDYGPILVVDNCSTDETAALARQAGCEVLLNKNAGWVEDFETTERVQAAVKTDWLYWGFADEIVPRATLAQIKRIIEGGGHDVITIQRRNYLYGQLCGDVAASQHAKVFKRGAIDFRGNTLHNFGQVIVGDDRVYRMPPDNFVHHLIGNTASSYLNTINRYTDLEVGTKPLADLNKPTAYYLLMPLKALWLDFFCKGGRRAGHAGLALSALMLIYSLMKAIKGYEALYQMDATWIAQKNQDAADELLQNFP